MIIFVFTSCWLGLFALKIYDDCFRDFSENRLSFDLTEGRFLGEKVIFLIHDTVLNFRWLSQIWSKAELSQYFLKTSFCCLLILLETFSIFATKKNTFFAASCRRDFLKSIFEGLSRQSATGESLNLFHELYFFFVFGKIQLILSCRWRRGWTESQVENLKNLAANRQKIFPIITNYFQNNSNYHKIVSKYIEISWSGKHKQTGGKKAKTYFPNITKYFQFRT